MRVERRESDFHEVTRGVNPLYYQIAVCPQCLYAAYLDDFATLAREEADALRRSEPQRRALAGRLPFTGERDVVQATRSFELAIQCYQQRQTRPPRLGGLYHRLAWLPRPLRQRLTEAVVTLYNGGPRRAGLPRPDAPVFATHPVVNSELLLHLRHGRIAVRPDIARFDGNEVVFVDGRREPYDLVIFATGYAPRVPYLPAEFDPTGPALERLYLRIFPLDGSPLAFVGLIQPNGCLWNLAERQAQLVARHLSGRWQLPPDAAARTAREWAAHRRRYVASPRHRLEVDWHDYERALRRALAGR